MEELWSRDQRQWHEDKGTAQTGHVVKSMKRCYRSRMLRRVGREASP